MLAFHLEKVHLFLINLHLYSHFPTICETMKNSCIRQIPCRLSGAQRIGRGIKWGTRWLYTYMGAFWAGGLQHPKVPHHSSPSSWQRQLSTGVTITSVDLWKTLANPTGVWREPAQSFKQSLSFWTTRSGYLAVGRCCASVVTSSEGLTRSSVCARCVAWLQ